MNEEKPCSFCGHKTEFIKTGKTLTIECDVPAYYKSEEIIRSSARREFIETIQAVPCGQSMYADSREFKIALDMKKEILRAVEDKEGKGE